MSRPGHAGEPQWRRHKRMAASPPSSIRCQQLSPGARRHPSPRLLLVLAAVELLDFVVLLHDELGPHLRGASREFDSITRSEDAVGEVEEEWKAGDGAAAAWRPRTLRAESVATPTRMRMDVPPKPRNVVRPVVASTSAGAPARTPRKTDPSSDRRSSTVER